MRRKTKKTDIFAKPLLFGSLVCLALVLSSSPAFAQDFFEGIRPSGMGGAYNAVGAGTGSLYHNPGGMMRMQTYSIDGFYQDTPTGNLLGAAIVDSKLNPYIRWWRGLQLFLWSRGVR